MSNFLKTTFLLTGLTLLLILFGRTLGGARGMAMAFVFACFMNYGVYWFSDRLVLSFARAVPLSEIDAPEVYQMTRELCQAAKLPMPRIYLIPSAGANAFATGRDPAHAVVAVTQGIVGLLNEEELSGVIAHELGHIANRDTLIAAIAATLAGAISMLASMLRWALILGGGRGSHRQSNPIGMLAMSILMPFAAMLIQLAVSRSREFEADSFGAKVSGNPLYLASALKKLEDAAKKLPMREVDPAGAHLYILNPLKSGGLHQLFSTHPPIEKRIARLERMSRD